MEGVCCRWAARLWSKEIVEELLLVSRETPETNLEAVAGPKATELFVSVTCCSFRWTPPGGAKVTEPEPPDRGRTDAVGGSWDPWLWVALPVAVGPRVLHGPAVLSPNLSRSKEAKFRSSTTATLPPVPAPRLRSRTTRDSIPAQWTK